MGTVPFESAHPKGVQPKLKGRAHWANWQKNGRKKAAVAEGDTTAALLKMQQPGEGG